MPANAVKLFGLVSYFVFILKRRRPWNFHKLMDKRTSMKTGF